MVNTLTLNSCERHQTIISLDDIVLDVCNHSETELTCNTENIVVVKEKFPIILTCRVEIGRN